MMCASPSPVSAAAEACHSAQVEGAQPAVDAVLWGRLRQSGDRAVRETLIRRHLPYARIVAASYYARRTHDEIEFGDYLQLASLGLLESVDRFEPSRGVAFETFAARRMHGAILDGLRRLTEKQQQIAAGQRARHRRMAAGETRRANCASGVHQAARLFAILADLGIGVALGYLLEDTGMLDQPDRPRHTGDPCQPLELKQLQRRIRELIPDLGLQEQAVIRGHYLDECSFDDIALRLGVSRGRVSQIHRRALRSLRVGLDTRGRWEVAWWPGGGSTP